MKKISCAAFSVLLILLSIPCAVLAANTPIHYQWDGTFEAGSGPLNGRSFTIEFTAADPSVAYGAEYFVDAKLSLAGVGIYEQSTWFRFASYAATTAGLGGFTDVLSPGDSLFFGICTGGSCNEPILWNVNPESPVLFTGSFPLGLTSSCTFPEESCGNAFANYFDGQGGGNTTSYVGNLVATAVPEPGTVALMSIGLAGIGLTRRRWTRSLR